MITFILGYKNLLEVRKETSEEFFEMMDHHLRMNRGLECLVCDYASTDGIEEYLTSYRLKHIPVEPYPNQYLNLPKCYNKGVAFAKNNIITTLGTDMRLDQSLINGVIELFRILGEVIVRPLVVRLDKDGKPLRINYSTYFIHKINILKSGGFDERMYGWGKEDDDIIERIYRFQNILHVQVRNIHETHVYHDDSFRLQYDNENLRKNHNAMIMMENLSNNGKNLINSYWSTSDKK